MTTTPLHDLALVEFPKQRYPLLLWQGLVKQLEEENYKLKQAATQPAGAGVSVGREQDSVPAGGEVPIVTDDEVQSIAAWFDPEVNPLQLRAALQDFAEMRLLAAQPTLAQDATQAWTMAMAEALGYSSGFDVPLVPSKEAFVQLFQQIRVQDAKDARSDMAKELANMHHDLLVVMQAAWIEWQRGAGANSAMQWIHNTLMGPGLIPDDDEPYASEPQAYFDANKADPFPQCFCGRPSNQLWMGLGFCGEAHYREHRAAILSSNQSQAGGGGRGV